MSDVNPVVGGAQALTSTTDVPSKEPKLGATEQADSKVSDMGALKEKAPEVYRAFEESIFRSFAKASKDRQDRIKKLLKNNGQ